MDPCPACLRLNDVMGDHAMSCGSGGERIARNYHLRDAIFEIAVAAGLAPTKEGWYQHCLATPASLRLSCPVRRGEEWRHCCRRAMQRYCAIVSPASLMLQLMDCSK